jgi:hypothetical protein
VQRGILRDVSGLERTGISNTGASAFTGGDSGELFEICAGEAHLVIAKSEATKQSTFATSGAMDCIAEPVIGRRYAPNRWSP